MMMIIITRYPASEDRLIVRPLLSRVCALQLQPAEPQPYMHTGGLRDDPGAARWLKCARAGRRVDRRGSYASVWPEWKIEEVSRVGAQGVTSKSKLLSREMPDLHTGGLRADPGAARWLKGARAGRRVDRRGSYASV